MTDDQIKHMTERFLGWKLPENFSPDCGISAKRPNYAPNIRWEPMGTNLFDYTQAEAMVRHMVEGIPSSSTPLCEHGHTDRFTSCNQCSAREIEGSSSTPEVVEASVQILTQAADQCSRAAESNCSDAVIAVFLQLLRDRIRLSQSPSGDSQ